MQETKILRLTMDNFKGRRHLELDLNGGNLNVYGTNAAGKTTIFDAFTWLLFGKNSNGDGAFGIKPLDKTGQVRDHTAITTVEALLLTGQGELALRRTYYEKWSTKRGSAAETFDGHAGLDAIAALSEHYGVRAPLVLDGTESFVELVPVGTQVIRLEVSKQDRELRFEYA